MGTTWPMDGVSTGIDIFIHHFITVPKKQPNSKNKGKKRTSLPFSHEGNPHESLHNHLADKFLHFKWWPTRENNP